MSNGLMSNHCLILNLAGFYNQRRRRRRVELNSYEPQTPELVTYTYISAILLRVFRLSYTHEYSYTYSLLRI
jgi:hypothetical protein